MNSFLATQLACPVARRDGRSPRHDPRFARLQDRISAGGTGTRARIGDLPTNSSHSLNFSSTSARSSPSKSSRRVKLHSYLRDANLVVCPKRPPLLSWSGTSSRTRPHKISPASSRHRTRVSQLRSEALMMLKEGIEAQIRPPRCQRNPFGPRCSPQGPRMRWAISDSSDWTRPHRPRALIESRRGFFPRAATVVNSSIAHVAIR